MTYGMTNSAGRGMGTGARRGGAAPGGRGGAAPGGRGGAAPGGAAPGGRGGAAPGGAIPGGRGGPGAAAPNTSPVNIVLTAAPGGAPGAPAGAGGRGGMGGGRDGAAPGGRGGAGGRAGGMGSMGGMGANSGFDTVLINELIPYIDANFRTLADQSHRAMAGLSMGGMETHTITLAHPDTFAYYGLLSGGTYTVEELTPNKAKIKLVFMSCGSKEGPDGVKNAATALTQAGFKAVSYVSDGTAHEFQTWRRSLHELAPLMFQD
jgi:hypothetical protein